MTAKIIDGSAIAKEILQEIKQEVQLMIDKGSRAPSLATVLLGDNPASKIYVKNKRQTCNELGIISHDFDLTESTTENDLLALVDKLNNDKNIDGILIQMPLPPHIDTGKIIDRINPDKDVDGFCPYNLGKLAYGRPNIRSCTPKGIMTLLKKSSIVDLTGFNAVIIGASNIVGKPIALELLAANCTVTICHIYTRNISFHIRNADLLIAAAGVPNLIKGEWIKQGAIVIDVGFTRMSNGKIIGDVEFAMAKEHASYITPVPGGVGPMTIAMLMENTLICNSKIRKN